MDRFDKLENLDDNYFKQYKIVMDNLPFYVKGINTSKSIMNLVSLNTHINFLKNSMFDLYESENIIAMNVLYRSVFDYFLKFQYLFLRLLEEKNNDAVNEYLKDTHNLDIIGYINTIKFIKEKFNPSSLSDIKIPEINTKINNRYTYKKLVEFIVNKIHRDKNHENNLDFLVKMLLKYTELSKYVHGGIYDLEYYDPQKRQEDMLLIIDITCKNAIACLQQIVLVLYQNNKNNERLTNIYNTLDKLLKINVNTT